MKVSRLIPVLAMATLFLTSNAFASPIALKIQSGSTIISISDNGQVVLPGVNKTDQNPDLGKVAWSGNVGGWALNVDLGLGSQATDLIEDMDLTYNATAAGTPSDPLILWFTEVNVPQKISQFQAGIGGSDNKTTTTYRASYDAANGYFTTGTLIYAGGLGTSGVGPGSMSVPYSVTQMITISATGKISGGRRIATGDAELIGVPEPSTLLLLGSVLGGFAIVLRRRAGSLKA